MPKYRKFGNEFLDKITNLAEDIGVRDTQSGFRSYSKKAINIINFKTDGFGADSEILISATKNDLKITEEKITVIYNTGSDTSTKNPISHTGEVVSTILEKIAIKSPMKFLGTPGIIIIMIGIYFAVNVFTIYNDTGYFSVPFTLIGATFLVSGLVLFLMATILFSVSKRPNKKL